MPALAAAPGTLREPETFLDLEEGWRLRAVMGLLRDGSVGGAGVGVVKQEGLSLTVQARADLVGFATDFYRVSAGMRIEFLSGERVAEGKSTAAVRPALDLFAVPQGLKRLRLLYLLEASQQGRQVDHSMALLAAADSAALEALTRRVQADPLGGCRIASREYCEWVPAGVALRAEKPSAGAEQWVPAR